MTCPDSEVNSFEQSVFSWASGVLARLGISLRAWAVQFLKSGGSLGTITGAPGFCAAWLLAATYIQWLNAAVVIGLPDTEATDTAPVRSDVAELAELPEPPFWGTRAITGISLAEYVPYLDERATFMGQWGLKPSRGADGVSYEELVEEHGRPRLRMWLERARTEGLLEPAVAYGYFPCVSEGNDLVILDSGGKERERFTFPRQRRDRRLCLADFFASRESGRTDVVALQLATMGSRVSEVTGELFAKNSYRDYLELHGLSVQLTEALAEYWHTRVRRELGIGDQDSGNIEDFFRLGFRGARYSFGYPACPDLADRAKVARLLRPEEIGVELTEEMQLVPEQSTDALVVHHPEAKYFST